MFKKLSLGAVVLYVKKTTTLFVTRSNVVLLHKELSSVLLPLLWDTIAYSLSYIYKAPSQPQYVHLIFVHSELQCPHFYDICCNSSAVTSFA